MALTFVALMLSLRCARVPWRVRILLTPAVAVAAATAGILSDAWLSLTMEAVSQQGSRLAFAIAAANLALSQLLSIFSFPIGYGERTV